MLRKRVLNVSAIGLALNIASAMGSSFSTKSMHPIICDPSVMSEKAHGTCTKPVMQNLRWNCDIKTADNICCFNRHFAEHSGYFEHSSTFLKEVDKTTETTYYDSVTGKPLFIAPRGRPFSEYLSVCYLFFMADLFQCGVM